MGQTFENLRDSALTALSTARNEGRFRLFAQPAYGQTGGYVLCFKGLKEAQIMCDYLNEAANQPPYNAREIAHHPGARLYYGTTHPDQKELAAFVDTDARSIMPDEVFHSIVAVMEEYSDSLHLSRAFKNATAWAGKEEWNRLFYADSRTPDGAFDKNTFYTHLGQYATRRFFAAAGLPDDILRQPEESFLAAFNSLFPELPPADESTGLKIELQTYERNKEHFAASATRRHLEIIEKDLAEALGRPPAP